MALCYKVSKKTLKFKTALHSFRKGCVRTAGPPSLTIFIWAKEVRLYNATFHRYLVCCIYNVVYIIYLDVAYDLSIPDDKVGWSHIMGDNTFGPLDKVNVIILQRPYL